MKNELLGRVFRFLIVIAILIVLPLVVGFLPGRAYFLHLLCIAAIFSILAMSFNLTVGFAGLANLAHVCMFGIGAYSSTILIQQFGVNYWIAFLVAPFAAVILGALIGVPSLRLRGIYFAIITIAFAQVVQLVYKNWFSVTGGTDGLRDIPNMTLFGLNFGDKLNYAYVFIFFAVLTFLLIKAIMHSRVGRAFSALREGQDLAMTTGVNVTLYKITAFLLASFIAGYAGALYAPFMRFVDPEDFSLLVQLNVLSAVAIGGLRTFWGPIIGSIFIILLPEFLIPFRAYLFLIQGVALVIVIVYAPRGLMGGLSSLAAWWRRKRSTGGVSA